MSRNSSYGSSKRVYVRPVDVAEFIYNVLEKKGKLDDEIEETLEATWVIHNIFIDIRITVLCKAAESRRETKKKWKMKARMKPLPQRSYILTANMNEF